MTDAKDFGAKGDGQADDTEALQHTLDQGGGSIVLARGTYRLTKPLVVDLSKRGWTSISGNASLLMEAAGPAIRVVGTHEKTADPKDFRDEVWTKERMPAISGIEIVGGHDRAEGIELTGTMQATLTGVLIRRCRRGVHLIGRNRNFLMSHCHIYDGREGAIGVEIDRANLHQAIISGCHISYQPQAGIKVHRSEVRNLQITGCDIEYNFDPMNPDSADVFIDAREGTIREGTIASNTIQAKSSPTGANLRIEGPDLPDARGAGLWAITGNVLQSQAFNLFLRHCRGVAISGNSFASGYERSIVIDRCRHISIGSSTFDNNPDYSGPRTDGISIIKSSGITLTGLNLEGTRSGTAQTGGAIEVFDSSEVSIVACQILDPQHRGIDLRNVHRSRVSDCTILDRSAKPTMDQAIRVGGESTSVLLSGNIVNRGIVYENSMATAGGNIIAS